jgi:hypothetical protein
MTAYEKDRRHAVELLAGVEPVLRAALEQSPELLPARALLGRTLAATGQHQAAVAALAPVAAAGRTLAVDELALAGALLAGGERDGAREAIRRAAAKGADPHELRALAVKIDRALVAELGLK